MGIKIAAVVRSRIDAAGAGGGQIEITVGRNVIEIGLPVRFERHPDENDTYRIGFELVLAENLFAATGLPEEIPARRAVESKHTGPGTISGRITGYIALKQIPRSGALERGYAAISRMKGRGIDQHRSHK